MIFTGKSVDGSDMYPVKGVFVRPDGKEWSNMPYTKEDKMWDKLYPELAKRRTTLAKEYKLVLTKNSTLSRQLRDFVIHLMTYNND